jgi:hypothetical protein
MSIDLSQYYVPGVNYNAPEYAQYGYMPAAAYYALFPNMVGKTLGGLAPVGGGLSTEQLNIPGATVAAAAEAYQAAGGTGQVVLPQSGVISEISYTTPLPVIAPVSTPLPVIAPVAMQGGTSGADIGALLSVGLLSGISLMLSGHTKQKLNKATHRKAKIKPAGKRKRK